MKKNIIKKIFIKLSKLLGYELIDQNEFYSPTLNKELNKSLTNDNKSIILPLGEVKITRKVKSFLIILRVNTNVDIWDQNKKRLFEFPKIEYTLRSLNSLVKSINFCKSLNENINFKLVVIDDNSPIENIAKIEKILQKSKFEKNIIKLNKDIYKNVIKDQKNNETFSNLSSLLKSFEVGKELGEDLVFFVEDDYIHFEEMIEEMVATYQRISSQIKKDLFICPSDYPYLYMDNTKTDVLIGSKRHWRSVNKTLCTFMTSKKLLNHYWENFYTNCLDRNDPFEKYLNEIYKSELCLSPLKSLSVHLTNINSSYGLSPFIDYKKIWEENHY